MDELYLGHALYEYLFMILYMAFTIGLVWTYVRIQDLKEQRDYYKYLVQLQIKR